jgi:chromosome segregation ATPase
MDTNIVPVTEAEMATWTQRLMTTVVGYSKQSAELEEIKQRVNSLYDQVSQLRSENANLHKERDEALALAVENEGKLNDTRRHRDDLEQRVHSLNEAIIGSNREVSDLRGLLTSAKLDAEDKQRQVEARDRRIADLENTLASVSERRDHWQDRAQDAEKELGETKAKLQKVVDQMTTMSDILGIVQKQAERQSETTAVEALDKAKEQVQEVPAAQPDPRPSSQAGPSGSEQLTASLSEPSPRPWWEQPISEQKVG